MDSFFKPQNLLVSWLRVLPHEKQLQPLLHISRKYLYQNTLKRSSSITNKTHNPYVKFMASTNSMLNVFKGKEKNAISGVPFKR